MKNNPLIEQFQYQGIRQEIINRYSGRYEIPGMEDDLLMIPMSGGADSSVMAIVMTVLFWEQKDRFLYYFSDTKAETQSLYDNLNNIEKFLGISIYRDIPEKGLFELIEDKGGLLPGKNLRYCTKELKLDSFERYVNSILKEGQHLYSMVGIRYDENRTGLISHSEYIHTEFPFKAMKITRNDVFRILSRTVGVPLFYAYKTRGGCSACPYTRKNETLALIRYEPEEFVQAMKYEKPAKRDLQRFMDNCISLYQQTGMSANHFTFPVPESVDVRYKKKALSHQWGIQSRDNGNLSLFGETVKIWVGVEFFVHPMVGGTGIWHQELVTFSTTRNGLSSALQNFYWHRMNTPEVYDLTPEEMDRELKLVMYCLEFPEHLVDIDRPTRTSDMSDDEKDDQGKKGCYLWKGNISYKQMLHINNWVLRSLHYAGLLQIRKELVQRLSSVKRDRSEELQFIEKKITTIQGETGTVLDMGLFMPNKAQPLEEDEETVTCFACSI